MSDTATDIVNDTGRRWGDLSMTEKFLCGWRQAGFEGSDLTTEYVFHDERKWRFDIAWPGLRVAVELDGMGFGHQAIARLKQNYEKQNAAAELGWIVLRYESKHFSLVRLPDIIEQVCNVLMWRAAESPT